MKSNIKNIEELNDETHREKGLKVWEPDGKGRWMTVWLTPKETVNVFGLKMKWNSLGLELPFSKILRALMQKGIDNVDFEELQEDPMSLFQEAY